MVRPAFLILAIASGITILSASDSDPAKKLYEKGLADTKNILKRSSTHQEKHSAFSYLQKYLKDNQNKFKTSNKELAMQLKLDVRTINHFLSEYDHKVFSKKSCQDYKNYVFYRFKVEPEDSKYMTGAPKDMLELYELACE